jgi:hypothetical protein
VLGAGAVGDGLGVAGVGALDRIGAFGPVEDAGSAANRRLGPQTAQEGAGALASAGGLGPAAALGAGALGLVRGDESAIGNIQNVAGTLGPGAFLPPGFGAAAELGGQACGQVDAVLEVPTPDDIPPLQVPSPSEIPTIPLPSPSEIPSLRVPSPSEFPQIEIPDIDLFGGGGSSGGPREGGGGAGGVETPGAGAPGGGAGGGGPVNVQVEPVIDDLSRAADQIQRDLERQFRNAFGGL